MIDDDVVKHLPSSGRKKHFWLGAIWTTFYQAFPSLLIIALPHQKFTTQHQRTSLWYGEVLSTKDSTGMCPNMSSKISHLVYEWPLIKGKIWYMNGLIFPIFPILEKSGDFAQNWAKWITFSWKFWYLYGLLSNSAQVHPYQNQTWVPPGMV